MRIIDQAKDVTPIDMNYVDIDKKSCNIELR